MSALHQPGRILVLNGASSSGKSSLAVDLQLQAPDLQLLHLQLDAFRAMEPPDYWSAKYSDQAPLRVEALCRAIGKVAAEFARCGQNVVMDHVLTPKACTYLLEELIGHHVLLVKVECSLDELERREAQRGNRELGLARSQLASVHRACSYDLEIDSTSSPAAELAREVAAWLRSCPIPRAHARMQEARNAA